jgi:hypothetical protein
MNVDSFGSATVPIQLGRGFIPGEIANYPTALLGGAIVPTQAHVQSRWSDGTVKHAILVFYLALQPQETKVVCFGDQNTNYNAGGLGAADILNSAWNFDATVRITEAGSESLASARQALAAGRYETWFSGLGATSLIIGDRLSATLDLGSNPRTVRPMFYATFFPFANAVRIRFSAETTNSEALGDKTYGVNLQVGAVNPTTVYARSPFTHHAQTVWSREFWLGQRPPRITIKHNLAYLAATHLLPNYDPSIQVAATAVNSECSRWLNAPREIGQRGLFVSDMGSSGGRGELGLLPRWVVMYLYTGNACLQDSFFGHADLAGAWPMFLREGRAGTSFNRALTVPGQGRFLSFYSRPSFWINGQTFSGTPNDRITPVTPLAPNPFRVDWAHMPDLFSTQYLLSGDRHYLEMLQGQALSALLGRQPGNSWLTRGPYGCFDLGTTGQTRADAWLIRTLASALAYSPDGTPETNELRYRAECLVAAWHGAHNLTNPLPSHEGSWQWARTSVRTGTGGTDCGMYGSYPYPTCTFPFAPPVNSTVPFWAEPAPTIVAGQVNSPAVVMPWQYNYLIAALTRAQELGLPTNSLLDWVGRFTTDLLLAPGYNRWLAAEYYFPARDPLTGRYLASVNAALPLYTPARLSEAQSGFIAGLSGVEHSYSIILRMALEMMADSGDAPAARQVYAEMIGTHAIPFELNPQWGVIKRIP